MLKSEAKQLILKPQDLVVALKVALHKDRDYGLAELASELGMALSSLHGSIARNEQGRLLSRSTGSIRPIRAAVHEFVVHGAKYSFPGQLGPVTRGIATSIGGPTLREHFEVENLFSPVWPDPAGTTRGPGLTPLFPGLRKAILNDAALYDSLTLLDALRIGAARERELAVLALQERLA
ncbi:MAG: MarR family transcriptional regulator [Cytophagaceae bacterium]|nr:MAG: MarR family transcriptional regulator [Cytophagaceae bacterium]